MIFDTARFASPSLRASQRCTLETQRRFSYEMLVIFSVVGQSPYHGGLVDSSTGVLFMIGAHGHVHVGIRPLGPGTPGLRSVWRAGARLALLIARQYSLQSINQFESNAIDYR